MKAQLESFQIVQKNGACCKNIPSERLRMPHKKSATICDQDNAKLMEYLHRPRGEHPNVRPAVVL